MHEALIEKYEIPTNYIRIQLEANQMKDYKDEYIRNECDKVKEVLRKWSEDPLRSREELGVLPPEGKEADNPITDREVQMLKNFLKKYDKNDI